jgi:hypothetical protein
VRRDEIYVRTHTRKNKEGDIVPLPGAEIFIVSTYLFFISVITKV